MVADHQKTNHLLQADEIQQYGFLLIQFWMHQDHDFALSEMHASYL
jgi:hypothetical protein